METNQAWQTVLGQLQMEMPRASYDTWVRDTRPISYEDGLLTIGVRNAYARDWLESRLSSTVSRLLIGIMNRTVDVVFVVNQLEPETDSLDDDEYEQDGGETFSGQSASGSVSLQKRYSTTYQEEVNPDRVITYPGYLVRPVVQGDMDPSDALTGISFKQEVYPESSKTGQRQIRKNIPHDAIIKWAVISRTSYFRKLEGDQTELCGGLVQKLPQTPDHTRNNRRLDNANLYLVNTVPPLTKLDSSRLEHVLAVDVAEGKTEAERIKIAEKTLLRMINMPSYGWLDDIDVEPLPSPAKGMVEIVRRVAGFEEDMTAGLYHLAEKLQDRIINKFGLLVIPHHFLLTTVPALKLNAAQTWAIIVLRYLRYYDNDTREWMDFTIVHQGLKGLAKKLSVTPRAFKRWVKTTNFGLFIARAEFTVKDDKDENEKKRVQKWVDMGGEVYWVRSEEPPLWYEEVDGELLPHWTLDETKMGLELYQNETHPKPKRDSVFTKMGLDPDQNETPLNKIPSKFLPNSYKNIQNHPSQDDKHLANNSPLAQGGAGWDMSDLLTLNSVSDPKLKARLLAKGNPTAFVSWLIYGYSPNGQGLHSPVSHAVSKLGKNPHQGAGQGYYKLARFGPDVIRELIHLRLHRHAESHLDIPEEFRQVFKRFSEENIFALKHSLFSENLDDP